MSERPDADTGVDDGAESEVEDQTPETEPEGEDEEGDGEEPEPRKKAEDWEKRAHNAAGQAAREKSRRRAAERRASDLEARMERLEHSGGGEDQFMELIGSLSDDEEDPIGDIMRVKAALKLMRARQMSEQAQSGQVQAVTRQIEALKSVMEESEEDFASDHPDYMEAAAHYRNDRTTELKEAGYSGRYLDRKLADDLFGVVRFAIESGQDPAERVYALAQKRGFKAGARQANGKLDKLQAASEAGRGAAGAQRGNGSLSWGDVAKLDGAARDKAWAKLRDREMGRDRSHR
jgi:hypothetical protein